MWFGPSAKDLEDLCTAPSLVVETQFSRQLPSVMSVCLLRWPTLYLGISGNNIQKSDSLAILGEIYS